MKKLRKRSALLAVGLCMTMLCGCAAKEEESASTLTLDQSEISTAYDIAQVMVSDVVKTERINCMYRQIREQAISMPISGRIIDEVCVSKGQSVKSGDLLVKLKTKDLEDRLDELNYSLARNQLLLAQNEENLANDLEYSEVQYLYHSEQTDQDWVDKEKANNETKKRYRYSREDYSDAIALDQEEIAMVQQELDQSKVYSELDGTIISIKDDLEGSTSNKDDVIMTVADGSECLFETQAADFMDYFKEGVPITMESRIGPDEVEYQLVPYNKEGWTDEVQTFEVINLPEGVTLEVGTAGTIVLETDRRDKVLSVPIAAIHTSDDKEFVYMMDDNGMRKVVFVETGLHGDSSVEIKSGLSEQDKVILK